LTRGGEKEVVNKEREKSTKPGLKLAKKGTHIGGELLAEPVAMIHHSSELVSHLSVEGPQEGLGRSLEFIQILISPLASMLEPERLPKKQKCHLSVPAVGKIGM
jgi:hypothetical protein